MLKINNYLWTYNGCLKNQLLDLYVSITMDIKKSASIRRTICKYYNGCKKNQQLFTKHICGYGIFEMALWKL